MYGVIFHLQPCHVQMFVVTCRLKYRNRYTVNRDHSLNITDNDLGMTMVSIIVCLFDVNAHSELEK